MWYLKKFFYLWKLFSTLTQSFSSKFLFLNLILVVPIWNFIFVMHNNYLIIISFLFFLFQTWTMGKHMVKIGCLREVLQLLSYYIFLFIVSLIWFYVFAFASHWWEKQWSNCCWVWNNKCQRSSHCNYGISKGMVSNIRIEFAHIIQNMKQHFTGYHPMVIDFQYINIIKHWFATFSFSENTFLN